MIRAEGGRARSRLQRARAAMVETGGSEEMQTMDGASATACSTDSAEKVVKWNCVFRVRAAEGIKPGDYPFRMFVLVGDLATVTDSLRALHREFAR